MDDLTGQIRALIRPGRCHEATGAGRRGFAAMLARGFRGPVVWIAPPWREGLAPQGVAAFFDPARLVVVRPDSDRDVWWAMEEALRSGAAPLVVAEVERPADLTQSRRLQLAAEAGPATGICLFTGRPAANAAETRWRITPLPGAGSRQDWTCLKNKRGPTGSWQVMLRPGSPAPSPAESRRRAG